MLSLVSIQVEQVYVKKILKSVENRTTAGSGTNYESSYAQFVIERLLKRWHIDQNKVTSTSS